MNKAETIQLLVVAAEAHPADRLLGDLRHEGHSAHLACAATVAELRTRLQDGQWDVVVCFEGEEGPSAEAVLPVLRESGLELPCVVAFAEDAPPGHSLLRLGASDLVPARERERLAFAVQREAQRQRLRRRARLLELSLKELENRHQVLLDSSAEAVSYVREGIHLYCSPGYAAFFGFEDRVELRRTPLLDLFSEDDREALREALAGAAEGERRMSLRGRRRNGSSLHLDMHLTPVEYDGAACVQLRVNSAAANPAYVEELAELDTRDLLTRLHNRAHFMKKLENAIAAALRQGRKGALLVVRLNEFLDIESIVGRGNANLILADISRFLQESARKAYLAARLAPHEFGLLLYEGSPEEALKLADFIKGKINNRITSAALPSLELSCSVGLAVINENALDAEELLTRARSGMDASLELPASYQFRIGNTLTPGMNGLLGYLPQAIGEQRFKLLFQPVVNLKGDAFQAYDVLTRLLDQDGNEIPPAAFIPLVNLAGLGERLDLAVVGHALDLLEKAEGTAALILRLTSGSLASRTFLPWLSERLAERRGAADRLAFQISEVELQRDPQGIVAFCQGLEELNLRRVVTHFGCALDPFRLLPAIKPDYVILDESLLRDILYSGQQKRNVQTLVEDLHRQGFRAGAPRVEDMDLLPMLWDIGLDLVQGYCLQGPSQEMNYEFTQEQEITLGAIPGQ